MMRVSVLRVCVGAGLSVAVAGCAHLARQAAAPQAQEPSCAVAAAATHAPAATAPCEVEVPADGFGWDEVARLAASRSREAGALLLDAVTERRQAAVDTAWRNPQLRAGWSVGDADEETPGRTGMRTYPDEPGSPTRPFTRNREWSERSSDSAMAGLRVYVANPFVNRWLRKRGEAAAQAKEEESREVGFALFCEVRALCLEAEMLREEAVLLQQMAALREQACEVRREQSEAGIVTALEQIRAETRLASLRSEMSERLATRQQLLRRIAVLAGVPPESLRLKPREGSRRLSDSLLDAAALTELACLRRPDLARLRREVEAAGFEVASAEAGRIPWFEHVEGRYDDGRAVTRSTEANVSGSDRAERDETEWQVRLAVTLPVFSWMGDEVRLSRSRRAAAEARERGLLDEIVREVEGVLQDYREARAERDRCVMERERLLTVMAGRIDALAAEPTVRREDILEAREELLRFVRVCLRAEQECLRLEQHLESVSGGPLQQP